MFVQQPRPSFSQNKYYYHHYCRFVSCINRVFARTLEFIIFFRSVFSRLLYPVTRSLLSKTRIYIAIILLYYFSSSVISLHVFPLYFSHAEYNMGNDPTKSPNIYPCLSPYSMTEPVKINFYTKNFRETVFDNIFKKRRKYSLKPV